MHEPKPRIGTKEEVSNVCLERETATKFHMKATVMENECDEL